MKIHHRSNGFTLIELVVVISILAILSGALVPQVTKRMATARDARRLNDMNTVRDAIEQFYLDRGEFPKPKKNNGAGGWDVSYDNNFIPELLNKGYLREAPKDPKNDQTYHYRYHVYAEGSYGCKGSGPYYVLGIKKFETEEFRKQHKGYFRCANRNWANEFEYVTGGGASRQN